MARWQAHFNGLGGKIHLGFSWRHFRRYHCWKAEKVLEWSHLSYDRTAVSTRSIYVELEATLEENRMFWALPEGVASQMIRESISNSRRSQDVCSSPALVMTPRRLDPSRK